MKPLPGHAAYPPDARPGEPPHDVLAADEFPLPWAAPRRSSLPPDPAPGQAPRDVLAADEFPLPWAAPRRSSLPPDPARGQAARDVLAAEAFPLPAGPSVPRAPAVRKERRLLPAWVRRSGRTVH